MSCVFRLSTLAAFLVAAGSSLAQPGTAPKVNQDVVAKIPEAMRRFVDDKTVAGVVTLVSQGNDIVEFDAQGMADIEAAHPMRKDTIFQIMSMTKPVTAIAIMMLAEEGKLAAPRSRRAVPARVQEPPRRHQHGTRRRTTRRARPRHHHPRSAHAHRRLYDAAPAEIKDYQHLMNVPLDEVVRQLAKEPLLFQPGTAWSYSSAGIEVLGRIIEVCSGQKYEDFITERILRPLRMQDSFFFPPPDKVARIAMVYVGKDGSLVRAPGSILGGDPTKYRKGSVFPAPGWGLYSTAEDLLHLYRMMLNGGVYEGHRYLSQFSVHVMTEPHTSEIDSKGWMRGSDYGLAWEVVTDPMGELAGHSLGSYGHGGAFGTQGWIDPGNQLISIMLIQRADGGTESMTRIFLNMAEASVNK